MAGDPRRLFVAALYFVAADLLVFALLRDAGVDRAGAHLAAYGVAIVPGFGLVARGRAHPVSFAFVAVLVGLLRGGFVALWIDADVTTQGIAPLGVSLVSLGAWLAATQLCLARRAGPDDHWRGPALFLVWYSIVLRCVYAPVVELLADEAYYWQYARHLALSYLDHPPLVGWSIAWATSWFGDGEWAVRLPAVLAWVITAYYVHAWTREVHGERSAVYALVLVSTLPLCFGMGLFITPDIPSYAAWSAVLYYGDRALVRGERTAWFGMGLALGLGLLAKYSLVFLLVAIVAFIASDARSRTWLRRIEPYATLLLVFVIFLPVLIWNAERDWLSFSFQSTRRLAVTPRFSLHLFLLHVALLLTPTGLIAGLAWFRGARTKAPIDEASRRRRFVACCIFVPLAILAAFSFRQYPRFHWTGAIWLAALPFLAHQFETWRRGGVRPRWLRAWVPTLAGLMLIYATFLHAVTLGLPGLQTPRAADYTYWRDALPVVVELRREWAAQTGMAPVVVGMAKWSIPSALEYYDAADELGPVTARHLFGCAASMYEFWRDPMDAVGRPVLLIGHVPEHLERDYIDDRLVDASPVGSRNVMREGKLVRRVLYRTARRYLGPGSSRGIDPPPFDCGTGGGSSENVNKNGTLSWESDFPVNRRQWPRVLLPNRDQRK